MDLIMSLFGFGFFALSCYLLPKFLRTKTPVRGLIFIAWLLSLLCCLALLYSAVEIQRKNEAAGPQPTNTQGLNWREEQVQKYFHGERIAGKNAWWLYDDIRSEINEFNIEKISGKKMSDREIMKALRQKFIIQYNPLLDDVPTTSTEGENKK